jgi:probable F420-dependent oxidoreductase
MPRIDCSPWGATLTELVEAGMRAEQAGADGLWSTELHRDPFVSLAGLARETDRAVLGTGIALAFARAPLATALAALDLDDASNGRAVLGLGSGVKRLVEDRYDRPFDRPVRRMRETIEAIRAVVAGADLDEPIDVEGETTHLRLHGYRRPFVPNRRSIPIYVAAVGPQMTRLAGEVADGWIGHELMSPAYLAETIRPALAEPGRLEELTLVGSGPCAISPDRDAAIAAAAPTVAFYASVRTYRPFFEFHGFGDVADAVSERFRAGDTAGMVAAVPPELVTAVTFAGTPDEVVERITAYGGLVDALKLRAPTYFLEPREIRAWQESLLSALPTLQAKGRT